MDFFDIGTGELLLILLVALLLFGPQKIPDIARSVGKAIGSFKKSASEFTTEITKEIDAANKATADATAVMNKEIAKVNEAVSAVTTQVDRGVNSVTDQTNKEAMSLSSPAGTDGEETSPQGKLPQSAPFVETINQANPPAKL